MRHLLRYGLVGAAATAVHYAVLVLCVELGGLPAYLGSGLGAVIGAQAAYAGNRWFTFEHRGEPAASWTRFQCIAVLGACASMGVVGGLVRLGQHYLVAQVLATALVMLLTFQLNRAWTFR
jgi:putative flippase GtrA